MPFFAANTNIMETLRRTALYDTHVALGAKMVPFAGFDMPVRYTSDVDEHLCVRQRVGMFDVSHMGEFWVEGPGALELIQYVTSNDAAKLVDGQVQYSCLPNDQGGIVDDLLVYRFSAEKYLLVVNASNIDKDWDWITRHNRFGATLRNASDELSLFAVQGPKATEALQSLTSLPLADFKYYTFQVGTLAGVPDVLVSATGYTGAGGFEIYVPNAQALTVWQAIMEAGKGVGLQPIGLGARDTLRLEMGLCLYGNDIDDTTSPLEAGLGWITKFSKDFINRPALEAQKAQGTIRKLVGFVLQEKGIPRSHYPLLSPEGQVIGEVTSGSISPILNQGIGMGYVRTEFAAPGTEIAVEIRGKALKAQVVKLPFISPK